MMPRTPHVRTLLLFALATLVVSGAVFGAEELPSWEPDANAARSDIPGIYHWNLDQLFASDEAWKKAETELAGKIEEFDRFHGKLTDPAALEACLGLYFDLHDRINHVTLYANLKHAVAVTDDQANAMVQTSLGVMDEFMKKTGFIRSEVLALPDETLEKGYADRPGLAEYRTYLDNLRRRRARVLDPEAERVLALAGDNLWAEIDLNEIPSPLEDAFGALLSNIVWPKVHDDTGAEVQMTLSNYGRFRASKNREVRKEAVTDFLATLRQFQNVFAATLVGQFELDVTYARARNYDTAAEAYLDKDDLDTAVLDNLINAVNANLEPLHRYVELRRKALGVDEVHLYDLYVPLVASVETTVTFPEARETILEALKPLGDSYGLVLAEGIDPASGWMDLYPSADKESGAFSANVYGRHPYVFMNYQDSSDDMSTLAHEFGHALHSYLSMKKQPYSSFRYPPFLAEVASTANEALLGNYLIARETDPARKASLLVERLEGIRTTIYRQTLFAEFEKTVHGWVEEGRPITAKDLDDLYAGLVRRYYGPKFFLGGNDGMEWAYIPHFYYKFYVFNYATGLSSGIAIAERIRQETPGAIDDYLEMLEGGCSKPPLDLLRSAGVDLTKPDAIEAALRMFDETITELEKLLNL